MDIHNLKYGLQFIVKFYASGIVQDIRASVILESYWAAKNPKLH